MEGGLQPQMVRPQLYISSLRTELCRDILEQNGITHILQVGFELQPSHPQHFKYLQLPVYDMPEQDIVAFFPQAFDFIDAGMDEGGGVLVHCQAGISRSATVVIAYCMAKERLSADAATAVVAAARSRIWPNNGFKCQLEAFERLGCDPSRWEGWSMNRFLSSRYGDESVDFMAAMLGGAPQDRCAAQRQQQQQQGEQQVVQLCVDEELLASPFAGQRADAGAAHAPRAGSSARHSCTAASSSSPGPSEQGDSCVTDQRPGSRSTAKSPHAAASSPEGGSARPSDTMGGGSCCRGAAPTGPRTTRRMSCAVCTGGPREGGGGGGHRLRRHSTGQYALAAAAAGVTAMQLGALGHLQLSSGTRLPEEAALLMAG